MAANELIRNLLARRRLNRNLIVCTSQKTWDLFVKQVANVNQSESVTAFRYMLQQAIASFPDHVYDENVTILQHHSLTRPMDAWMCEIGPEGDRIYFEFTPYHDRMIFTQKDNVEMIRDVMSNPIQVAYPECMVKPLVWLPFTTQVVFDGQGVTDLTKLIKGKS